MTATTATNVRPTFSPRLLLAGIVASLVIGMWQMILEAVLPNGSGFWAAAVYIAATVLRDLQTVTTPVAFHLLGVVGGLAGHMMNSVILGLIFAFLIAPRLGSTAARVVGGVVYGVAVFLVMWFVALPLIDPVMLRLNALVFLIGHMMWGAALALVVGWSGTRK
jgi:hypothetical protein